MGNTYQSEVDWKPIYISSAIIIMCLIFLYYKLIMEILYAAKNALVMIQAMLSNRYSLSHLLFGWPRYLFAIKHEYGYGSSSTASEVALENIDNLLNKTIICTGGNSGVGYAICSALSAASHKQSEAINASNDGIPCCIIMASRNKTKSHEAIKQILKQFPNADIQFMQVDLGKLQSITAFVNRLKKLPKNIQDNIAILINNAGISMVAEGQSVKFDDNLDRRFEKTFAVNYLGPFILTQLIYDTYFKNNEKHCRIVNQSSIFHTVASALKETDLLSMDSINKYHLDNNFNHAYSYGVSKLFNIVHAKMMFEEYKKHNVLFNSCHPGTCFDTGMIDQHFSADNVHRYITSLSQKLFSFLLKSEEQMGATAMLLACDKRIKLNNITGAYFEDCGVKKQTSNYTKNKKIRDNLKKYSFSIYNNIK